MSRIGNLSRYGSDCVQREVPSTASGSRKPIVVRDGGKARPSMLSKDKESPTLTGTSDLRETNEVPPTCQVVYRAGLTWRMSL